MTKYCCGQGKLVFLSSSFECEEDKVVYFCDACGLQLKMTLRVVPVLQFTKERPKEQGEKVSFFDKKKDLFRKKKTLESDEDGF